MKAASRRPSLLAIRAYNYRSETTFAIQDQTEGLIQIKSQAAIQRYDGRRRRTLGHDVYDLITAVGTDSTGE